MTRSGIVTKKNWQGAAAEALRGLPTEVQASLELRKIDDRTCVIGPARKGGDEETDHETLSWVEVRFWHSLGEYGWPPEQASLYQPGGAFADRVSWPLISIGGEGGGAEGALFVGRGTTADLEKHLQLAILEEIIKRPGQSKIKRDGKGRYVKQDGTPVLDWQFPKRKP
jgi:hypothetical protein